MKGVRPNDSPIIGRSEAVRRILREIEQFAPTPYPILISGETGTGKDLVAREIHRRSGRRGPFVPVNCACLPETVIDSELFGHIRGAFTGAEQEKPGLFSEAHRGTLFLDELETLSPAGQDRILRVVETGQIRAVGDTHWKSLDIRILAATNVPPGELLAQRRLREDLYHRLSVLEIRTPPLRSHMEDLPLLCRHILERISRETRTPVKRLAPEALDRLRAHSWPGNVRELQNQLRRAVIASRDTRITAEAIGPLRSVSKSLSVQAYARRMAEEHAGKLPWARIASELGVSRKTLWSWRQKWAASASPLPSAS